MKIKLILNIILVYFFLFNSQLIAETIFFDSKNIKIEEDGNMVYATKGKARIPSKNIEIEGDKFVYDKKNSELIVFDNVRYIDIINDISIESNKLIYNEINNTVFSYSDTFIEIDKTYEIFSSDVLYNRTMKEISSKEFTEVNDTKINFILKRDYSLMLRMN